MSISLPPMIACVLCGEISRAAIAMPVLWVTVCGSPGLVTLELGVSLDAAWDHSTGDHSTDLGQMDQGWGSIRWRRDR